MSFLTATGQFAMTTAAATSTQSITGLGFSPVLVMFFWNGQTVSGQQDFKTLDMKSGIGWAAKTSAFGRGSDDFRCFSNYSQNNVTPSVTWTGLRNDNCIATITTAGAWEALFNLTSWDSSGFTLVVNQASPSAYQVTYFAIGGSDIAGLSSGVYSLASTTTPFTVSTGFKPNFVFGLCGSDSNTADSPSIVSTAALSFAMASAAANTDIGQQYSMTTASKNASASAATKCDSRNSFLQSITSGIGIGSTQILTNFTSGGFETTPTTTTLNLKCYYFAIQGGVHRVGQFMASGVTGGIMNRQVGFQPNSVLMFTDGDSKLEGSTLTNTSENCIGIVDDSLINAGIAAKDVTGVNPTQIILDNPTPAIANLNGTVSGFAMWDPINTGGIKQQVAIGAYNSDGFTTLDVVNAGATYWTGYWAMGPTGTPNSAINPMAGTEITSRPTRFGVSRRTMDPLDQDIENLPTPPPTVPVMPWDTDGEQQLQQMPFGLGDGELESDSGVELVQLPPLPPWDTDADSQLPQPLFSLGDGDLTDSGVEKITLPPVVITQAWDTDAEQQQKQAPSWYNQQKEDQDRASLITLPSLPPLDQDIWADQPNAPYQIDRDLADTGVELITLPPLPPFEMHAEQQRQWAPYDTDRDLVDSGVELITLPPLPPLDLDIFSDRQWGPYDLDRDVADAFVERIQLPPLPPFDTDADWQPQVSKWPFVYDAEEDRQWTNLIILPPLVTKVQFWDTDAENQIPSSPYTVEAVEHQDRSNLVILPPLPPWDTDAEQQRPHPDTFRWDNQEIREGTNFVVLPPAPWVYELMDQLKQEGVGIPAQASDQGQDWQYLIILPPPVVTQPFDTDAEQQRQAADWAVERETSEPAPFIIYAPGVLTGWDTDAKQQRPPFENFNKIAEEDQDRALQIILPPFVTKTNIDTDAENQLSNEVRFTDRMVESQDRSNLIVLPFLPPFDTDADAQFEHPKVPAAARHEWTHEWIVSIIATLVRKAMALLYARSGPQAFALGGGRVTQVALLPNGQRVVNQTTVLGGGFSTDFALPTITNLPSGVDVPTGYGTSNYGQGTYD